MTNKYINDLLDSLNIDITEKDKQTFKDTDISKISQALRDAKKLYNARRGMQYKRDKNGNIIISTITGKPVRIKQERKPKTKEEHLLVELRKWISDNSDNIANALIDFTTPKQLISYRNMLSNDFIKKSMFASYVPTAKNIIDGALLNELNYIIKVRDKARKELESEEPDEKDLISVANLAYKVDIVNEDTGEELSLTDIEEIDGEPIDNFNIGDEFEDSSGQTWKIKAITSTETDYVMNESVKEALIDAFLEEYAKL